MVLASWAAIKWLSLNQRLEDLEEVNESLIAAQNNLQLMQERHNRRTEGILQVFRKKLEQYMSIWKNYPRKEKRGSKPWRMYRFQRI